MKTEIKETTKPAEVIPMKLMKPCQMGWVVAASKKTLVMRTASRDRFEIMDLSELGPDSCWTSNNSLMVELLTEPVTVTFIP